MDLKWLDYYKQEKPKCIYCNNEIDIADNDLFDLYYEGENIIVCPYCDKEILVETHITYEFSTKKTEEINLRNPGYRP